VNGESKVNAATDPPLGAGRTREDVRGSGYFEPVCLSRVFQKFVRGFELLTTGTRVIRRGLLLTCRHISTIGAEGNNCLCGMRVHAKDGW
jgi:hypothetical protein